MSDHENEPRESKPASHAAETSTGDRSTKHGTKVEPHETLVPGVEAERAAESVLDGTTLSRQDILKQASYRGTDVDVGQQAATARRAASERTDDARANRREIETDPTPP